MAYLLSGTSRGLNPWIESTACQVVTVPPSSSSASDECVNDAAAASSGAGPRVSGETQSQNHSTKKARGARIVQVLGRGGGWVDPQRIPTNHPQRSANRCLSCPPILVLSDGQNTVTAFLTPPPRGSQSEMAQNAQNSGGTSKGNIQLPSDEVSKICRRGTLVRIRDWTYTTMMLGGGRHYRHLTGSSPASAATMGSSGSNLGNNIRSDNSSGNARTTTMLSAVLPQNVPLTTPLALSVPWSSIEFIAGENGTVPINHAHRLVDVNDSVELRRILMDGNGTGPKNHLELSQRIKGWEEYFAVARLEMERTADQHDDDDNKERSKKKKEKASGRNNAVITAAILAGRVPTTAATSTSARSVPRAGDRNGCDEEVGLGDPTKLLGARNLSALLQTGTAKRRSTEKNEDRQQQLLLQEQRPELEPRQDDQRGVCVGHVSRLLTLSVGREALRGAGAALAPATAPKSTTQAASNITGTVGLDTAPVSAPLARATAKSTTGSQATSRDAALKDDASAVDDDDAGPALFADEKEDDAGIVQGNNKTTVDAKSAKAVTKEKDDAVGKKSAALGNTKRLMASTNLRAALRSVIPTPAVGDTGPSDTVPAPIAPPAAAVPPAAAAAAAAPVQPQAQGQEAPPRSQKRRRGGVPRRSRTQQQAASTNEGASSSNAAAKTKPTTPQQTLAALQSLNAASLHSLFNQILSSGVELEDDVERDSEEVPTPRKLSAMRERPTQEVGEGSANGKDDEPLDLTFLLSDSDEVDSSPGGEHEDEKNKAADDDNEESTDDEEESENVGIGDMLVPPTQEEQQQEAASSQVEMAEMPKAEGIADHSERIGGESENLEGISAAATPTKDAAIDEVEESVLQPRQQPVERVSNVGDTGMELLEAFSDEEHLSQETSQGTGENTAEGSPKRCAPTFKVRGGQDEVDDSDATVDEQGALQKVAAVSENPKEGHDDAGPDSDSDTTAGEPELRLPATASKTNKIKKSAPTTKPTKASTHQGARSRAAQVPPPRHRRPYAYDSSSSSDSDDWAASRPVVTGKKKGGTKKNARKRHKHLAIAPPDAKKPRPAPAPRPAPKKAAAPTFSIQAMLARKRS